MRAAPTTRPQRRAGTEGAAARKERPAATGVRHRQLETHPTTGARRPRRIPQDGPPAGYPDGHATVPAAGQAEDVSSPTTVIGTGTPASCTGDAFVAAVAKGGVITFDCGPDPVTIVLTSTAKVFNDKGTKLVIDGGNKVTLSGGGTIRILYMATCDKAQVYPPGPGDCNTNPGVQLVVQNITFVDGSAKGIPDGTNNGGGGGAIHAQGGSLKVVNSRFFNNVCDDLGSDVGGGAIRKLDYLVAPGAGPARPVWIVNSTFGGKAGLGNSCANGGALSSIGVSWNIINTLLLREHRGRPRREQRAGRQRRRDLQRRQRDRAEHHEQPASRTTRRTKAAARSSSSATTRAARSRSRTRSRATTRAAPSRPPNLPGFYVIAKAPAQIVNSQILR